MDRTTPTGYCTSNARRRLLRVLAGAAATAPLMLMSRAQAGEFNLDKIIRPKPPKGGTQPGGSGNCLLEGTMIATREGEKPVQDLGIGDLLETADGSYRPIKWIGRQTVSKQGASWEAEQRLVRINAGAIEDGVPSRDVWLTPAHGIYVAGYLINADTLVNGRSIISEAPRGETYTVYHVELEDHRVILANGLPVETLLVEAHQTRDGFDNAADYTRLYGAEQRRAVIPYAARLSYNGLREEIRGLVRASVYPLADLRDPIHRICDDVVARASRAL